MGPVQNIAFLSGLVALLGLTADAEVLLTADAITPEAGKQVGSIAVGDNMHFAMDVTINSFPDSGWDSVFQCGTSNSDRWPGIFVNRDSGVEGVNQQGFFVQVNAPNSGSTGGPMGDALATGQTYHLEVDYTQNWWSVRVDGETILSESKSAHSTRDSVPCYAAADFGHDPADVLIENLVVSTDIGCYFPGFECDGGAVCGDDGDCSAVCDPADMAKVDWHDLLNGDEQSPSLLHSETVEFDASSLSLTFSASLEYVGKSADGNFDHDFNLGTTFWIDFQPFSSVDGGVDSAGNCANRRSADYSGLSFVDFWEYPANPADLDSVTTAERMAYPPSDWTLNAVNCTTIQYERTLSWTGLTSCQDAAGNGLIAVEDTNEALKLSGTFFVELLSPYLMSTEDHFRTFPLVQQGFEIVLNKQLDVVATTGVALFISSVMAYGRNDDDGSYEVTVLIQSADYVSMSLNDVAAVTGPLTISDVETVAADCLVASSFTCGQIFTAKIAASCSGDGAVDLSGSYQFAFTPQCRVLDDDGSTDPVCDTFMTTLDESSGSKVALGVDASFIDLCEADLFTVQFAGELTFYSDDQFAVAVDANSGPFVIGQDTIYGKVTVNAEDQDINLQLSGVNIEAVYVCTAEPAADLTVDAVTGLGGCWSSDIDADGPYNVIGVGAAAEYQGTTMTATELNEARFSFLTFDTPRTDIYVHVQALLDVTFATGQRRRVRMLLQSEEEEESEANQFRSFVGTASVQQYSGTDAEVETDGAVDIFVGFFPVIFVFAVGIMG